eukprot:Em0369g8a
MIAIKVLVRVLLFSIVVTCTVFSKLSLISLVSRLNKTIDDIRRTNDSEATLHDRAAGFFWQLLFIILIPQFVTFFRALLFGVCGKQSRLFPWPTLRAILTGVFEVLAMAVIVFYVLPHLPSIVAIFVLSGVFSFEAFLDCWQYPLCPRNESVVWSSKMQEIITPPQEDKKTQDSTGRESAQGFDGTYSRKSTARLKANFISAILRITLYPFISYIIFRYVFTNGSIDPWCLHRTCSLSKSFQWKGQELAIFLIQILSSFFGNSAGATLWIGQMMTRGVTVWKKKNLILAKDAAMFLTPRYDGIFLEQYTMLNRQLAKHCKEKNNDDCFESHIFMDNGVNGTQLTYFALQLLSLFCKEEFEMCPMVIATPYGAQLKWNVAEVMPIYVHLKDSAKIKKKKRWSQVMYMNYVLNYREKRDTTLDDDNTFILTTDADIQFTPESATVAVGHLGL